MKRFDFPLDRVLKMKRQFERVAELEQQRAGDAVNRARAILQGHCDELVRISNHVLAGVGRPVAAHHWAAASDLSGRIGQSIQAAEAEIELAEKRLRAATQKRARVATEVEALATLRHQQLEVWQQEVQQVDQERLTELGLRRWQAARDEATSPPEPS